MRKKRRIMAMATLTVMVGLHAVPYEALAKNAPSSNKSELQEKQKELSDISSKKEQIYKEIKKLDQSVEKNSKLIREQEKKISVLDDDLSKLHEKMTLIQESLDERNGIIDGRLLAMQTKGQSSYLDVLLGAEDFGDLISRVYAVSTIISSDNELMENFQGDMELLEKTNASIEESKSAINRAKEELEQLTESLNQKIKGKNKLLKKLKKEEDVLSKEISKLSKIKSRTTSIRHSKHEPSLEVGMFIKPTKGIVTSEFKHRIHPIFGYQDFHQGIDIANPASSVELVAAADGVITRASYFDSYGNVVFISHKINGQTFTTVYAHQEGISVKVGQKVKQGDFIGYMGTSGNSTGKHLHFEIHVGEWATGQPNAINPRTYVDF
ncbi:murein hydrolase activator EnvC [Viridibacillus arvi]|uniref:murein hydrolase activator EnvC n=1 Tax=Viridibacillus arvi TaxID=263475 RepID=UPI0034CFD1A6